MIIRTATPADAAGIARFWNPLIRDTSVTFSSAEKSPAEVAALIRSRQADGHGFLVAQIADQLVGFASYGRFRTGGYDHTVESTIILAPEARNKGVGRALMGALQDHARAAGMHVMIAGISSENPGAIGFHKALGFTDGAVLHQVGRKFGRWMGLHLLQKTL